MKDARALVQVHVNRGLFERDASLVQDEVAMSFINLSGMLLDEMRHFLSKAL